MVTWRGGGCGAIISVCAGGIDKKSRESGRETEN